MTCLSLMSSVALDEAIQTNLRINDEEAAPLSSFHLACCTSLSAEQAVALTRILQKHHSTLGEVVIYGVTFELEAIKILSTSLATMPSLEIIRFEDCELCHEGTKVLADALVQMKALKGLILRERRLGVDTARSLAEALSSGKWAVLERLHLQFNSAISEEGVVALAESVSCNTTLKEVKLFGNGVGREGAKSWVAALSLNSTLEAVTLYLDNDGLVEAKALVDAFERNETLQSLVIQPIYPTLYPPYLFDQALKDKLHALNKYNSSPDRETHTLLKKLLQKQEEQATAIATLQGKVNQLMERDGDAEYVHIEANTRTDIRQ